MKRMSRMEGEKPTLMVIPMIDIIFFLLVFFMISTIYTIPQQSLSIMLPKTKTQQSAELRPVLIDFEKSGQLMIDDGYVTKEQLISSVKAKIGENKNQNFLLHLFIIINGTKEIMHLWSFLILLINFIIPRARKNL